MKILALIPAAAVLGSWLCAICPAVGVAITTANKRALLQGQEQVIFDAVTDGTKHKKRVPVTLGVMSKCVQSQEAFNATIASVGCTLQLTAAAPTQVPGCRGSASMAWSTLRVHY